MGQSYYGFKLFLLIDIATKTLLYVRFTTVDQSDAQELIPAVLAVHHLGFRLKRLGMDRGWYIAAPLQALFGVQKEA